MALDPDLLAMMPHVISVRHRSSVSFNGDDTFVGDAIQYRCRVRPFTSRRQSTKEISSWPTYDIIVDSGGAIRADDELTLSDGEVPKIERINDFYDEDGLLTHQQVLAGPHLGRAHV